MKRNLKNGILPIMLLIGWPIVTMAQGIGGSSSGQSFNQPATSTTTIRSGSQLGTQNQSGNGIAPYNRPLISNSPSAGRSTVSRVRSSSATTNSGTNTLSESSTGARSSSASGTPTSGTNATQPYRSNTATNSPID